MLCTCLGVKLIAPVKYGVNIINLQLNKNLKLLHNTETFFLVRFIGEELSDALIRDLFWSKLGKSELQIDSIYLNEYFFPSSIVKSNQIAKTIESIWPLNQIL